MYNITIINLDEFQQDIPKEERVLHLKSFCSMAGDGKILVGGNVGKRFQDFFAERILWEIDWIPASRGPSHFDLTGKMRPDLYPQYDVIHLPDIAASNCVHVNGTIIRRATEEFPESGRIFETRDSLKNVNQIEIVYDELAKVDGALTCCSLLMKA